MGHTMAADGPDDNRRPRIGIKSLTNSRSLGPSTIGIVDPRYASTTKLQDGHQRLDFCLERRAS